MLLYTVDKLFDDFQHENIDNCSFAFSIYCGKVLFNRILSTEINGGELLFVRLRPTDFAMEIPPNQDMLTLLLNDRRTHKIGKFMMDKNDNSNAFRLDLIRVYMPFYLLAVRKVSCLVQLFRELIDINEWGAITRIFAVNNMYEYIMENYGLSDRDVVLLNCVLQIVIDHCRNLDQWVKSESDIIEKTETIISKISDLV